MIQRLSALILVAALSFGQSVSIPTITLAGGVANMTRSTSNGTAGTSVTASESVAGQQHVTTLTFSSLTVDAIAGAAAEAVGVLLYTLPSGATLVRASYMSVALSNTDTTIDADTPDVGIGTVIATGAVATLDGTATFENILTGQTAADCTGTATVQGVTNQALVIATGGAHTVYLNVADTWAGSETALKATGTVTLEWVSIS